MEAEIINFNELKWLKLNFGRALVNDDVYKEWKMILQELQIISLTFYISQSCISSCSGFRQAWRTPYEMCSASYVREIGERSNLSKDYLSERGRPGTVDFGRLRADDDGVR